MQGSCLCARGAFAPDPMERTVMTSLDSFKCRKTLKVGAKTYAYYSLPTAEQHGLRGISRLPFSMKVLVENLLRHEDGAPSPRTTSRRPPPGSRPKARTTRSRSGPRAC